MNAKLTGHVHFLPKMVEPQHLAGSIAVVIDVLRATTTICHALAAGATDVRTCMDVEIARGVAKALGRPERCLLGGERRGVKIEGFDLGNSPTEYSRERVAGKSIVFTTTNGTRAIERCFEADQIVLAAFVNLSAVCKWLVEQAAPINIVCAGTDGCITLEDVLVAGAIVDRLSSKTDGPCWSWDDEALIAATAWRGAWSGSRRQDSLLAALRSSAGGTNLIELGYDADIETAARINVFEVIPWTGDQGTVFTDVRAKSGAL